MSFLPDILTWAVIVGGTLAAALIALTLTRGRPRRRPAGPDQPGLLTLLFLSVSTVFLASGRLVHGTAAWVLLSVAGCLTCAALIGEVRSALDSRSGPASDDATADVT